MKWADMKNAWRKAASRRNGPLNVTRVDIHNARGFSNVSLPMASNLTAVCGENGAGKSTLLQLIYFAIRPQDAKAEFPRLNSVAVAATVQVNAELMRAGAPNSSLSGQDLITQLNSLGAQSVTYLDAAATAQRIRSTISKDANFNSVLDGLSPKVLDVSSLALLTESVGRHYNSMEIYEIEDYNDLPAFPYFLATADGSTYDSEQMGLGELCIALIFWYLERIPEGGLLLLEEPEAHLPPRAQRTLMSHLAQIAQNKRFYTIITTHSHFTLEYLPTEHILMLGRSNGCVIAQLNPKRSMLQESLQISTPKRCVALFEDNIAMIFARAILATRDPALLSFLETSFVKGSGDLDAIGERWPALKELTLVCIYDGDLRGDAHPRNSSVSVFLPTARDPALLLRDVVLQDAGAFAQNFGTDSANVLLAVSNNRGTDPKDFFPSLRNAVQCSMEQLVGLAAQNWMKLAQNDKLADKFIDELQTKL